MTDSIAVLGANVPPEWIAAHGFEPRRLAVAAAGREILGGGEGVCPFVSAAVDAACAPGDAAAVVLQTGCDQMRRAFEFVGKRGRVPSFLLNVPATWESAGSFRLYADELKRLGRFLVSLGGKTPDRAGLAEVLLSFQGRRDSLPAAEHAGRPSEARGGIPVAVLGPHLRDADRAVYDLIEGNGGSIVLYGADPGERTRPAAFDRRRLAGEPFEVMAEAYFAVPDAFRRPNSLLYRWLGDRLAASGAKGILFLRYVWCDTWNAEVQRLREWAGLPMADVELADVENRRSHAAGRIQAFLEMLR